MRATWGDIPPQMEVLMQSVLSSLIGHRTWIVAVLMAVGGIAAKHGFAYDPSTLADAIIGLMGAVMIGMRAVTKTPIGKKEPATNAENPPSF
jgi:hypothetical protein